MKIVKEIFLLCLCLGLSNAANILYSMPFSAKSHYIMLSPIGLELARRGHNVTVITVYREENPPPNYHQVLAENKEIWTLLGKEKVNVFSILDMSTEDFYRNVVWPGATAYTKAIYESPKVKDFLSNNQTFDLVISELFFPEVSYMLAHKYQAPLVLVSTYGNCMKQNIMTRNPLQLSNVVFEYLFLRDPTSFWSRLRNAYFSMYEYFWWKYSYLTKQDEMAKKYIPNLPEPVPSVFDLQKNASIVLLNSHFSFDGPVAYLPNIIEIGGLHIKESKDKLPQDLQKFLDNSKQGVIYINFGTNVKSTELPVEKKDAFLNVIRRLKYNVLWKWEDDNLKNVPDNLLTKKWMPQSLILAHPNLKVFVSHGGLLGTQEAIHYGVPIIGVPVYNDQYNNLLQVQEKGFGKILEYEDINEENLYKTLMEVVTDDSFKNKAMEVSRQFDDRLASPMDTAMFWIEYVIRNNGASHMKNPALELSWIAYNMLDVMGFILVLVLISIMFIVMLVKFIRLFRKQPSKETKSGKKKRN